jgi:hypothetical protein
MPDIVTLSEAKGLDTGEKSMILRCAQNDNVGISDFYTNRSGPILLPFFARFAALRDDFPGASIFDFYSPFGYNSSQLNFAALSHKFILPEDILWPRLLAH